MEATDFSDFSAADALRTSKKVGVGFSATADNLNYTLTLKRVLGSIKASSERGERKLAYVIPWFIIDGTTANQNLLAKQVKARLVQLGYMVQRDGHRLYIDWDLDWVEKEAQLERKKKQEEAKARAEGKKRARDLRKKAQFGTREAKSINDIIGDDGYSSVGGNKKKRNATGFSVTRKKPK